MRSSTRAAGRNENTRNSSQPPGTRLSTPWMSSVQCVAGSMLASSPPKGPSWRSQRRGGGLGVSIPQRAVAALRAQGRTRAKTTPPSVANLVGRAEQYVDTVDAAVAFLQGRDPELALRIVGRAFLPEGPRFAALAPDHDDDDDALGWAF